MSRPFAVFDIDGTLIRWQLYHATINTLAKEGHLGKDAYKAIKQARLDWKKRTHPEAFEQYQMQLVNHYFKQLKNIPPDAFDKAAKETLAEYRDQTYTYTRTLIKKLKAQGYVLFAISGSHRELVDHIAEYYGFDDWVGSTFERKNGAFTGNIIAAYENKDKTLHDLVKKHDAAYQKSIAIGDSGNDIVLLDMVEQPVAFNPDQILFEHAKSKGWKIVVERKNVIYELESKHGHYVLAEAKS